VSFWPKPPRWPIQPGTVDPGGRWVWQARPRFILPLWEHAGAGAAQRYVRIAQTRRMARTWQPNTGAAGMQTRYGPGVSIPTDNGAEIEALAGRNPSFAAWEQNEPYTIGWRIDQAPVQVGQRRTRPHAQTTDRECERGRASAASRA
jgi:hypothetical protein